MIKFNLDAKEALCEGVNILANAVKCTLGPSGRTVLISNDGNPYITKDGVTVAKNVKLDDKFEQLGATVVKNVASKTCDQAGDGPQPLTAKVLTPSGWKLMGDLKVGDKICGTGNTIQNVVGVYPKGYKQLYKIHFANGQIVECCEDHLWTIKTHYGKTKTVRLKDMIGKEVFDSCGNSVHSFYTPKTSVEFYKKDVPVDPYLVGLLIGDGSLSKKGSIELSLALDQEYVLDDIILPEGITYSVTKDFEKHYMRVKFKRVENEGLTMHDYIDQIGLLNTNSFTKFIPNDYLFNDVDSRLRLLKGLEETDGHINNRGLLEYSTVSEELKDNIIELLNGLGKFTYSYKLERKKDSSYTEGFIYRIHELKGYKHGTQIRKIQKTDELVPMQCIKVSNEDHLYITNDYIVTHNTTTSTVITQAIINEGFALINKGTNPIIMKQGMDKALNLIKTQIVEMSKPIENTKQLVDVATISANNDPFIGELIGKAMETVKRKGIITVDPSESTETYVEEVEGIQFTNGYLSPYFINNKAKMNVEMHKPQIIIMKEKLKSLQEIMEVLNNVATNKDSVLIIVPDIESEVLNQLILNFANGALKCVVVKAPGFGEYQQDHIKDLAVITGNTERSVYHLGKAEKIIVNKDSTTIINGHGDKEKIKQHVAMINAQLQAEPYEMNKLKYRERLAKLQGGAAIIHVGALSEVEMLEKKDRIDDALSATRAAIEEGIVPGGGVTYLKCGTALTELKESVSKDEGLGVEVILRAISKPFETILDNAGMHFEDLSEINNKNNLGLNVRTGKVEDMIESGIIDPAKVTRTAIENAVSVAGMFLTTECCIINEFDSVEKSE